MQLPDLSGLPPFALVIFAVSLAIIAVVVYAGRFMGAMAPKSADGSRPVEIAAMTLDTSIARSLASAIEALNLTLMEQNRIAKAQARDSDDAARVMAGEIKELREELRKQGEALRVGR